MKRKTLISSILVIVLCLGLISGSTYALFTSESSVNIAITSGKVKLTASLDTDSLTLYSANPYLTGDSLVPVDKMDPTDPTGTLTGTFAGTYYYDKLNSTTFTNGGTAAISNVNGVSTLTLTNVTPGDKVSVNVKMDNESNVKIKYRIRVNVLEAGNEQSSLTLFNGLVAKIGNEVLNGVIRVTNWTLVDPSVNNGEIDDVPVEIFLPLDAGNEYQEKTTQIRIIVEAVQSNAATRTELEAINGYLATLPTKNPTMYDAIKSLVGANIAGLETLATYDDAFAKVMDCLWNVDTDRFYVESDEEGFGYKYFKAYTYDEFDALTTQKYSIYAYDAVGTGTPWAGLDVTVKVGFDAGETSNITSVTYDRSTATDERDVVIRTNSANTTLNIKAPVDTIKHYGAVGSLNIEAVANASYHEFGKVAFAEIKTGRIVLESESEVEHIHLTATGTGSAAYFNDITVAKAENVEMPEYSRDPVEIPTEGKLVVALQEGTKQDDNKEYVWLTAVGIYEQVTVSNSNTAAGTNYAANSNNQEQKDTAQQIANNISVEVGGDTYTVKAEKTSSGWDYVLVDEDKQVSGEYSVSGTPVVNVSTDEETEITTTTITVSVVDNNEEPIPSATSAIENGSDKAEEKSKYVAELISNDAELRAFLAGTKQKGKLANSISNPTVETKSTRYVYANGRNVVLDLAGFTLDGYEICVNDGSTLTLTGNGFVNLDDEEAVVIYNGTLVLAGAKITGNPEYSAPLLFANYDDNGDPSNCKLVVADDTANYIETSGDGASGIMVLAYYGDMNLTINGQEKHNGQLFVTAKTEDAWAAIRPYQGGANSTTIIDGLYIELSTESDTYEVIDGTGDVLIKTVSGSFSGNVTEHCQAGYCSKLNNGTGRYEIKLLTEEDATFKITSKSGAETLIAGSIYQAMALATEESTITVLKNCNITETAWNAPGAGADYFTIDLNGKTISGNDLSIKRPDPRNSNNVTMPVHVTVTNGTMSNGLMLYTYSYVTVSNVHFTNTTSSYATAININSNIKTNVYDWAEPGTNSITLNNCTFENKYIKLYGSNEGQKIDLTMTNCTMSKTYNGYNSMIEANSYVYGTMSLNGCTLNGSFNNAYTYPIKIESTSSSNGGNMVTLNLQDVEINVTGSSTKPVSIGSSWTVNEEGTNIYTVGGNAKNYDGSAIE